MFAPESDSIFPFSSASRLNDRPLQPMPLTPAEIQQALRISKAIEIHFEHIRTVNVPSTELYGTLADQKLVERDTEHGKHFRLFLKKLVKANMLNLIHQCKAMPRSGERSVS